MPPLRLSAVELAAHLRKESPAVRRVVLAMRRAVLQAVPHTAEGVRFGALSYFHLDVPFGSIGGNICMIEVRRGRVRLSFIHGANVDDPRGLLRGKGKTKRFVEIRSSADASDPRVIALTIAADRRMSASHDNGDPDFMAERNQPKRPDKRKSL